MRIAVVEPAGKGGLAHYAFQLCRALHEALPEDGSEVVLVTDRSYELDALDAPFRVERLLRLWDAKPLAESGAQPGPAARRPRRIPRTLRRIGRGARYYREQVRLLRFLRRLRPDVVQLGDVRFASDLAVVAAMRAAGLPLADVCHNVEPFALAGPGAGGFGGGRLASALSRRVYRRIYRRFRVVFVHGEENRRRFLETYGLAPERVRSIDHGNQLLFAELRDRSDRPVDAAALRRRLDLPPEAPVVLALGTLARYKGLDVLVEAFARLTDRGARLVIAGFPIAGFDPDGLRARARKLGIAGAVRVAAGYVPSEEVAAWMELATVAAYPHRQVYQSGALQVAASFGVPVVASRAGAIPDVVRDGETGLLVPPGDADALAGALARLLRDRSLARRLGERAGAEARTRFAWSRVAEEVLAAYADTMPPGSRVP